MGVDAQGEAVLDVRQVVIRTEGNKDFVSDPVDIEGQVGGRLEGQSACQKGDHASMAKTYPAAVAATFSITSSGMSKFACTFCTSSCSSRISMSFNICSAPFSSSLIVFWGMYVISASVVSILASPSAFLTASKSCGFVITSKVLSPTFTSSAPASSASDRTVSSSLFDL